MSQASYRAIGGPDGLLANRAPFEGNTMSAYIDAHGVYNVMSYATVIATRAPDGTVDVPDRRYSNTTSRQQNLCRAWL